MESFVFSVVLVGLTMLAMAVGVLLGGRRLKGSCGGPGGKDCSCSLSEQIACARRSRPGARAPEADRPGGPPAR